MFRLVLVIISGFVLTACSPGKLGTGTVSTLSNNGVMTPMVVTPFSANLQAYQSLPIQVTGGIPPYTFTLITGNGFVGHDNGAFAAAGNAMTNVIQVKDSSGASTTITILVAGGSPTSTSGNSTTTNCSSMLGTAYEAIEDTSSTGLAYGYAANFNDPTNCSNWCGQQNAGYCMWSPGSGTAAVCIAWPQGTSMAAYQSTWATYAGICQ